MCPLKPFLFHTKTRIQFGEGSVNQLGSLLKAMNVDSAFIVSDNGVKESGILNLIETNLIENEIKFDVFTEVEPNPSSKTVNIGASIFKSGNFRSLIAVGGGSPIDVAKGIAVLGTNEGSILDYAVGSGKEVINPTPFLIAIPTTAGTGSEVTRGTVITDEVKKQKVVIRSPYIQPDIAILDPLLTVSKPRMLTATTGMDALTHAIEAFISKGSGPISDSVAVKAMQLISSNLIKCFETPSDVNARSNMLVASTLAGMALGNAGLGVVHAISHPLGSVYGMPHGLANSIILPYGMEYNYESSEGKFAHIALALGIPRNGKTQTDLANSAIQYIKELSDQLNIPKSLQDVGVGIDSIDVLAAASMEQTAHVNSNPRTLTISDMKNILRNALV